jgi:hypothetical protein
MSLVKVASRGPVAATGRVSARPAATGRGRGKWLGLLKNSVDATAFVLYLFDKFTVSFVF